MGAFLGAIMTRQVKVGKVLAIVTGPKNAD